ncbi:hypothetical protein BC835DRAFT_154140 [Cytidiella melzeri]|nr:hypothetical protein BC835DRAFT_154140 [Cytidiella melzeri]
MATYDAIKSSMSSKIRQVRSRRDGCGAITDNVCTAGTPTSSLSRMLKTCVSLYDATVVEQLREAGASRQTVTSLGRGLRVDFTEQASSCRLEMAALKRVAWDSAQKYNDETSWYIPFSLQRLEMQRLHTSSSAPSLGRRALRRGPRCCSRVPCFAEIEQC